MGRHYLRADKDGVSCEGELLEIFHFVVPLQVVFIPQPKTVTCVYSDVVATTVVPSGKEWLSLLVLFNS